MEKKLKYLFEAEYYDGRIYKQNPQDTSVKFPPALDEKGIPQGRSAGADIQEDLDNNLIRKFSLVGEGNKISVDLATGIFEVNGIQLLLESDKVPAMPDRFRLIRYYQVSQSQDIVVSLKDGHIIEKKNRQEFREYFIGWECTIAGKNYKQKLAVA